MSGLRGRGERETEISLLLIVMAIAAFLCPHPVRSEPHGDMPPGWTMTEAPETPIGASLVQDNVDERAEPDLGSSLPTAHPDPGRAHHRGGLRRR